MSKRKKGSLVHYNQAAAIYGYQNSLYGEWLLVGDSGDRPCRPENWPIEDRVAFLGGEHAKKYYSIEGV